MAKKGKWRPFQRSRGDSAAVRRRMKTSAKHWGFWPASFKLERMLLYTWQYHSRADPNAETPNLGFPQKTAKRKHIAMRFVKLKSAYRTKRWKRFLFEVRCLKARRTPEEYRNWRLSLRRHPDRGRKSKASKHGTDVSLAEASAGARLIIPALVRQWLRTKREMCGEGAIPEGS